MIDPRLPFVLLDDARPGLAHARLYQNPAEIIAASTLDEVRPALARVRASIRDGRHAAGFMSYEAGFALEEKVGPLFRLPATPLVWFGLFDRVDRLSEEEVLDWLPPGGGAWAGTPRPRIDPAVYRDRVGDLLEMIAAGDIYQANYTFGADIPVIGHPLALYARLRKASAAGWGGVVHTGNDWLLSLSPELFFTLDRGTLIARPMKGTVPRHVSPETLRNDAKQRAENLMIVDLLRNDLARVSEAGSVDVSSLFTVETYPTLHTMTSTVTARLADGNDAVDVLSAIFPCGSVTGAPKIRAMEVIYQVEPDARGPYTGSIGYLSPDGDAAFNVAIRTLAMKGEGDHATIGLGSGIVADSDPAGEWDECLAKGAFVTAAVTPFDLIETMRFNPHDGLCELERHLLRMKTSGEALGFTFDRHAVRNELQAATFRLRDTRVIRLRLSRSGMVAIEVKPLSHTPAMAQVSLTPLPVHSSDFRLRHKTSDRSFYDDARKGGGTFETVFTDHQGFVTEGSFTNIFLKRADGIYATPPISRGLLPGVLRAAMIERGEAVEQDMRPADLVDGFFIGNALRGLIPATLVAMADQPGL